MRQTTWPRCRISRWTSRAAAQARRSSASSCGARCASSACPRARRRPHELQLDMSIAATARQRAMPPSTA
eukprot:scaffold11882_cov122-Isochrysis_galbana.AAC.3